MRARGRTPQAGTWRSARFTLPWGPVERVFKVRPDDSGMKTKQWIPTLALSAFAIVTATLADGVVRDRGNTQAIERTADRVDDESGNKSAGDLRRWLAHREALTGARDAAQTRAERRALEARLRDAETDLVAEFGPVVAGKVLALTSAPSAEDLGVRIAANR